MSCGEKPGNGKKPSEGYSIEWRDDLSPDQNLAHHIRNSIAGLVKARKEAMKYLMRMQAALDRYQLEHDNWIKLLPLDEEEENDETDGRGCRH